MRKLLTILLVLIAGAAQAQTPITYTPMNNYQYKYWKSDSGVASIPYGDTSIGRGTSRPGGLVCYSGDNNLYYWNGLRFVRIGAGGSGGSGVYAGSCLIQVNDSTVAADTTCLATRYYVDSVVRISNPGRSDSYIIEGSIYHVDSLHFRSTVFKYVLDGVYIEAPITDLFLSPADLVLNRTDVFYLASDSTVKTRVGTLVAGILEPPLLAGQLRAAAYTVLAGATTPANVSHIDIYREGTGPEWSHTAVGLSPTWQYATNPYPGGLYSINSNAFTTNNYIYFQGTPVDAAAITYLTMDVRNSHPYAGALNVRLHNSSANTDFVSLGLSNGYDKTKAGEWMNVVIPAYKIPRLFTLGSVNLFWLNFNGNDNNIQFDNIRLQLGGANSGTPVVVVPPVPTTTALSPNRKLYLRKDQYGNAMPGMTDSTLITTVLVDTSMTKSTSIDTVSIGLKPTGVTAGPYTNANLIVGADGRILGVSNGTAGSGGHYTAPGYGIIIDSITTPNLYRLINDTSVMTSQARTTAGLALKENYLGLPPSNGYLLASTTGGVRSWVAPGGTGTVTNFSKTDGYGITSSVTNPTTTPNLTHAVDTTVITSIPRSNVVLGIANNAINNVYTIGDTSLGFSAPNGTTFQANLNILQYWKSLNSGFDIYKSTGKVGIGTTTPLSRLTVRSDGMGTTVNGNDSTGMLFQNTTAATNILSQNSNGAVFSARAWNTTLSASAEIRFKWLTEGLSSTGTNGNMALLTSTDGGLTYPTTQLRIGSNGSHSLTGTLAVASALNTANVTASSSLSGAFGFITVGGAFASGTTSRDALTLNGAIANTSSFVGINRSIYISSTFNNHSGTNYRAFQNLNGDVNIGTVSGSFSVGADQTIVPTAIADFRGTQKGVLFPRLTTALRDSIYTTFTGSITNGGTLYANNTYYDIPFATLSGSGYGGAANITVAGGVVTSVTITRPGRGYQVGNTLGVTNPAIGGSGSGFVYTVGAITPPATGLWIYNSSQNKFNYYDGTKWQVNDNFSGTYLASGTGAATTISVPHGLTGITSASLKWVTPNNAASAGVSYVTIDATNVNIVYTVAPLTGTNNLSYDIMIKP